MTSSTRPNIGFARSHLEVHYWLELHRCPACGERSVGETSANGYQTNGRFAGSYDITCPACAHSRSIEFYKLPDFAKAYGHGHLGGDEPSQIISPHLFAQELERCVAEFGERPVADVALLMKIRAYSFEWGPLRNGWKCSVELLKFVPEGADEVPAQFFVDEAASSYRAAHPEQFTRQHILQRKRFFGELGEGIRAVVRRLDAEEAARGEPRESRPLPLPPFSLAALKFHEAWAVDGDGEGRQRMTAVGADARDRNLSGRNLSRVLLDKVTLDRANLAYTELAQAELTQVSAREAQLTQAGLAEATLQRCDFSGAELTGATFDGSTITDCKLADATLARASFRGAHVTSSALANANLTDAVLDEATFIDCDLRGTRLGITASGVPQIVDATFVRCDLREASWLGRELVRVKLVDCVR